MNQPTSPRAHAPQFIGALGVIAILGSIALFAGNVVGSIVVPNHDWVADTVSDLAAGRYEIIQDVTLYAYAGTLVALALAAAHLHRGSWDWTAVAVLLVVLALCVTVIGARNEYGDGDGEGVVIHIYVVYAMGAAYIACFAAAGLALAPLSAAMGWLSWAAAAAWAAGVPAFFMMPTAYDGAFERGLGVVSLIWTIAFGVFAIRLARSN